MEVHNSKGSGPKTALLGRAHREMRNTNRVWRAVAGPGEVVHSPSPAPALRPVGAGQAAGVLEARGRQGRRRGGSAAGIAEARMSAHPAAVQQRGPSATSHRRGGRSGGEDSGERQTEEMAWTCVLSAHHSERTGCLPFTLSGSSSSVRVPRNPPRWREIAASTLVSERLTRRTPRAAQKASGGVGRGHTVWAASSELASGSASTGATSGPIVTAGGGSVVAAKRGSTRYTTSSGEGQAVRRQGKQIISAADGGIGENVLIGRARASPSGRARHSSFT